MSAPRLRFVWLRYERGSGIDHELLWLLVGVAAIALGLAWVKVGLPVPACRFHDLTGLPCATCGSTRAVVCLTGGFVAAAFGWNPLTTLLALAVLPCLLYAAVVVTFRLPRLRVEGFTSRHRKMLVWVILLALCANWAWVLAAL